VGLWLVEVMADFQEVSKLTASNENCYSSVIGQWYSWCWIVTVFGERHEAIQSSGYYTYHQD